MQENKRQEGLQFQESETDVLDQYGLCVDNVQSCNTWTN